MFGDLKSAFTDYSFREKMVVKLDAQVLYSESVVYYTYCCICPYITIFGLANFKLFLKHFQTDTFS